MGPPAVADAAPEPLIPVQLIAMNDFHGRIANTSGGDSILFTGEGNGPDGRPGTSDDGTVVVGGSASVAYTVQQLTGSFRAQHGAGAASYFVGAGDLISASPYESSVFQDEPTIEVLNAMGLDASSVGNHEFDHGTDELRRISAPTDGSYTDDVTACEGVVPGQDGCYTDSTGAPFHGTDFPYLAANVISKETGQPMLPPYQVFDAGNGKKVALIGVVIHTTPQSVSPNGVADVEFIDEADAVNRWVPVLLKQGIKAIGVLIHEGGAQDVDPTAALPNGCEDLTGPIVDLNNRIDDQVDLILSAHTHQAYNCQLAVPGGEPRLVTSAGFYGRLLSDIRLMLKPSNGDVDRTATYRATNVPVTREHSDPRVAAIVQYWVEKSAEAGNRSVGSITADIRRSLTRDEESSLGNLIAQTQLEAMQQDQYGNPVIAFMNPGGLRTDLGYASSGPGDPDGNVTYKELFNIQPFGNTVDAVTLTGADVKQVLEEQFQKDAGRQKQLVLGTSEGLAYSYDLTRPYGDRVVSITLNSQPIVPGNTYRVVANSFLVAGGDSFSAFTHGTDPVTGPVDVDTSVAYFAQHSPVAPPPANHSTKIAG